jgi:hypothetical protein
MRIFTYALPDEAKIVDLRSFRVLVNHGLAAEAVAACSRPVPAIRALLHSLVAAEGGIACIGIYRGDATKRDPNAGFSVGVPLAAEAIEADTMQEFTDQIPGHTIEHTRGGLYAVGRFRGAWADIVAYYAQMLDHMIPATGYQYTGGDILELSIEADNTQGNVVDICVPVRR